MAKDTFYFSHDYNTRLDAKIKMLLAKHGMAGYGIYWSIIEDLYNNANALRMDYDCIAYDLRAEPNLIESVVKNFGLFVFEGEFFGSMSVQRRLDERSLKSKNASESAHKRWNKMQTHSDGNANASQNVSERNAIKERKGKEKKGKENKPPAPKVAENLTSEFLKYYNEFLDKQTNTTEKFSVAGRKGLSEIIKFLCEQVKKKTPGAKQEEIEAGAVNGWRWILSHFDKWGKWEQGRVQLHEINGSLINIINAIKSDKNGSGSKNKFDTRAVAAEIISYYSERGPESGSTNKSPA